MYLHSAEQAHMSGPSLESKPGQKVRNYMSFFVMSMDAYSFNLEAQWFWRNAQLMFEVCQDVTILHNTGYS